jgi:2,4-dienoyl-CoA reductase-like NADH-dependent reductase (Old Yellow Enzyme family)
MTISIMDSISIRHLAIKNRIWVSPMCQYSASEGVVGQWHQVHLGGFAAGGFGLIMVEATGIVPEGRISIACPGIWNDAQVNAFKPIISFAHSQNSKIGIQLAHSGRKGSTTIPGSENPIATQSEGGWETVAPSAINFHNMPVPRALTIEEIKELVRAWGQAAKRAVEAGFDLVEIHAAHGYLLHQFLSPLTNHRSDEYGGNLENRARFLYEVIAEVRKNIPDEMPLFLRISATDWKDGGWNLAESIEISKKARELGVDLIDVSTGGLIFDAQIPVAPGYQLPFSEKIKVSVGILTSAVGLITEANQANEIVQKGQADAVMIGRAALRNPHWASQAADILSATDLRPRQYTRATIRN